MQNKTGTIPPIMLYVDNRRLAEGSLSRGRQRAYRVVLHVPSLDIRSLDVPRWMIDFAGDGEWRAVMAGSVNKVILVGNLGKDPEIRRTQDGRPIANLSIA